MSASNQRYMPSSAISRDKMNDHWGYKTSASLDAITNPLSQKNLWCRQCKNMPNMAISEHIML